MIVNLLNGYDVMIVFDVLYTLLHTWSLVTQESKKAVKADVVIFLATSFDKVPFPVKQPHQVMTYCDHNRAIKTVITYLPHNNFVSGIIHILFVLD